MKVMNIALATTAVAVLGAASWWLMEAGHPLPSAAATLQPASPTAPGTATSATAHTELPALPLPVPGLPGAASATVKEQVASSELHDGARVKAIEAATDRIKVLVDQRADIGQVAAAVRDLKQAAGPQGLSGIDLDAAIEGMELAQAMRRKAAELEALNRRMRNDPQSVPKEELDQLMAEIGQIHEQMMKVRVMR